MVCLLDDDSHFHSPPVLINTLPCIICFNIMVSRPKRMINNIIIKSHRRFKDLRYIPFFKKKNHSNFYSTDVLKPDLLKKKTFPPFYFQPLT